MKGLLIRMILIILDVRSVQDLIKGINLQGLLIRMILIILEVRNVQDPIKGINLHTIIIGFLIAKTNPVERKKRDWDHPHPLITRQEIVERDIRFTMKDLEKGGIGNTFASDCLLLVY